MSLNNRVILIISFIMWSSVNAKPTNADIQQIVRHFSERVHKLEAFLMLNAMDEAKLLPTLCTIFNSGLTIEFVNSAIYLAELQLRSGQKTGIIIPSVFCYYDSETIDFYMSYMYGKRFIKLNIMERGNNPEVKLSHWEDINSIPGNYFENFYSALTNIFHKNPQANKIQLQEIVYQKQCNDLCRKFSPGFDADNLPGYGSIEQHDLYFFGRKVESVFTMPCQSLTSDERFYVVYVGSRTYFSFYYGGSENLEYDEMASYGEI